MAFPAFSFRSQAKQREEEIEKEPGVEMWFLPIVLRKLSTVLFLFFRDLSFGHISS